MRKHILPLTYQPKIQAVIDGKCTQTIRAGRKFRVGDLVSFHGWEGKPYRSKWSFRTPYWVVNFIWNIEILGNGFQWDRCRGGENRGYWKNDALTQILAEKDGIIPPTGEELGKILLSMHEIPDGGLPAQIIRWDPTAEVP